MSGNYIIPTHNSPSQKTNTWTALYRYMMGSVVQPRLKWGWNCTNNLVSKTFEVAVPATTNLKSAHAHVDHKLQTLFIHPTGNESVSRFGQSCPMPTSQKYTLKKMTFFLGSFTKVTKEKRRHRKQTSFEPLRHVTEEQHGRTDSQGQWEGNDAGTALINLLTAADHKSRTIRCSWSTCGLQRTLN